MNKKIFLIISFVVVLGLIIFNLQQKQKNNVTVQDDNVIVFEKNESWGGPSAINSVSYQSTKLYSSGKLILEGKKELQKQLDQEVLNNLVKKIKETEVMKKNCSVSPPTGISGNPYSVTYKLKVDNQEKIIQSPGCRNELQEIEKLIPISFIGEYVKENSTTQSITIEGIFIKDLGHPFSGPAIMLQDYYYRVSGEKGKEIETLENGIKIKVIGILSKNERRIPEAGRLVKITEDVINVESFEIIK